MQRLLGIIGGIGPESTIDYYRLILAAYRERSGSEHRPALLIDSIDLERMLELLNANRLDEITAYLATEIGRLAAAGAGAALLAANTAHIVFDEVQARVSLPLISIVEATCRTATRLGLARPALLGTRFTMQGRFYADAFRAAGMPLLTPTPAEQALIHRKYIDELIPGHFLPATRAAIGAVIGRLRREDGIDAVVLAGTELPLLLREAPDPGVPMLDTTKIHVDSAVDWLLG